ncbi:MAG TPA: F0F1 ATP synthase subunit B [Pirellulales bacterium]|jgi:F-type H+-transporting ATPase subunit b
MKAWSMGPLKMGLALWIAAIALAAVGPGAAWAADDAHAEAAHGGGHDSAAHGDPSPLAFNPSLAIWTLVVFALLLAVLWKFAWGPISQALDLREQKIADNIAAAEQCNLDAKRMLADYEAKLAGAREEVRAILEEARRDAEQAGQDLIAKARADAATEIERGKHEIETATSQALKELAETSANLAVDLAGRIVGAKLNAEDHANLITGALSNFPKGNAGHN